MAFTMNPKLIWPITVIGVAVVAGITILSLADKDVTALAGFGIAVLGGLLYGKIEQIKEIANGNTSRQHAMIEDLIRQRATGQTPPQ